MLSRIRRNLARAVWPGKQRRLPSHPGRTPGRASQVRRRGSGWPARQGDLRPPGGRAAPNASPSLRPPPRLTHC